MVDNELGSRYGANVAQMILQVHDELVFEIDENHLEEALVTSFI